MPRAVCAHDRRGVSPVIAVVLMVAITVVLASVVYLMVSSLITPVGTEAQKVGIVAGKTTDGSMHELNIIRAPSGLNTSTTYITVKGESGNFILNRTALSALPDFQDVAPLGLLTPGDSILLDTLTYPSQSEYTIIGEAETLASGRLL